MGSAKELEKVTALRDAPRPEAALYRRRLYAVPGSAGRNNARQAWNDMISAFQGGLFSRRSSPGRAVPTRLTSKYFLNSQ